MVRLAFAEPADHVVRDLQYEVREGREAGEVVVVPQAFIAKCNQSFILQLRLFDGGTDKIYTDR